MNRFRVFPNDPVPEEIARCDGLELILKNGRRIFDMTAGATSHMILGWNHPEINQAIQCQLSKFSHIDYKAWTDPNCEILAQSLVSSAEHKLDRVYFCGNSGGEACEAAIKMSYQWHFEQGNPNKQWVISRDQSYHGSSSDAMCLGDRPNLEMYRPILPPKRARICEHNQIRHRQAGESLAEYSLRSANELESKILEIGPENVACFVAETMMGGLVGDVPPAEGYWRRIREICTKYNVHMILDEVYCGTGTSGKVFCIDYDQITPDFLFMGKTLAAGYAPVSAVMTSKAFEDDLKNGQGRLQHTTTHQAYSLGIAAAIAVQNIVKQADFLEQVNQVGNFIAATIENELKNHEFFREVRGRGLRLSFEYQCPNLAEFSERLGQNMLSNHNIYISSKWHRTCFTPSLILNMMQTERVMEKYLSEFKKLADNWTSHD